VSADKYEICPRCKRLYEEYTEKFRKKVLESYGKVPVEEYLRLMAMANEEKGKDMEPTLAEYIEAYIEQNGDFNISFSSRCTECGFKFSFEHKQKIEI
jgi:predicted Zn-ribbon and HTH transcriptional regulator